MTDKIRNPACTFLRKLISPHGFGSKDASGYRRGETTYYFWADGRIKTPFAQGQRTLTC